MTAQDYFIQMIEQSIYDAMWQKFLDEQQDQVRRMDKIISEQAEKQAKIIWKKQKKKLTLEDKQ